MKTLLACTLVFALGSAALAKPVPVAPMRLTHAPEETSMAVGPAGALLESDYFRAPQKRTTAGRVFPCRLQVQFFEKTQLAQSCQ